MASEVKWIKIVTDIFDDEKMCAIESRPDGYIMELVWFKILCLAGKCNNGGFLYVANKIAYTDEMLAKIFRMEIGIVQRALAMFQELEMIEVVDNAYMVSNWIAHQNQNGLDDIREQNRIRQRRFREKQKALFIGENPICAYCGEPASGVDHIIPKSKGGSDNDDNKVACCYRCNTAKNSTDLAEFLNYHDYIKKDLVNKNKKLSRFVKWDKELSRYVTLQSNVIPSLSISLSNSNNSFSLEIKEIIDYLNLKAGTKYTYENKSFNKYITARLKEKWKVEDFKTVIDKKTGEWLGTSMEQYLKPTTLFAPSHFEEYLNQNIVKERPKNSFNNFSQREYTKKEMEELEDWLLKQ